MSFPFRTKPKKVVLFLWTTSDQHFSAYKEPRIAGVLDSRVSDERIEQVMATIHAVRYPAMVHERARMMYDSSRKRHCVDNSGRKVAHYENWPNWYDRGQSCYFRELVAERVENFCFDVIDVDHEIAYWKRPASITNLYEDGSFADLPRVLAAEQFVSLRISTANGVRNERWVFGEEAKRPAVCPNNFD